MIAAPENLALVRLGLEAATLEATHTGLRSAVRAEQIGIWRTSMEQRLTIEGLSPKDAALESSLLKGLYTGLMIDLMATGETERLSIAVEAGLQRHERVVAEANARSFV